MHSNICVYIYIYVYTYIHIYIYTHVILETSKAWLRTRRRGGVRYFVTDYIRPVRRVISSIILGDILFFELYFAAPPRSNYTSRRRGGQAINGRLKTIMWWDGFGQFSDQVIVFRYTFIQKQSPDGEICWQQSHHMILLSFRNKTQTHEIWHNNNKLQLTQLS